MRRIQISRRGLLGGTALAALTGTACGGPAGGAGAPGPGTAKWAPSPEQKATQEAIERALAAAKKAGASYADVRVVMRRAEAIATREDHVVNVAYDESYGIGVRVVADGAWGFAASAIVDGPSAERAAIEAVAIARAARPTLKRPVELAPAPVVKDSWATPIQVDPFQVPLADKARYLLDLWPLVRDVPKVKYATASFDAIGESKIFASSEGSWIEQSIMRVAPELTVTAVDNGEFESRTSEVPFSSAGWEYVLASSLKADARKIAEDAVEKLKAPSVVAGPKDLILTPSNMWLTIHESIGHSTELDRAMGLEANLAGTSFATTDKLGKLRYGNPGLTFYADKTTPGGLATCAYDDDGVKTQRWDLVKDGLFVAYQTTRDQAGWIGEKASRGTSYGQDYKSVAFQRMPNVSLAPREGADRSLEDIVAGTDDGVLVSGNGSWSIDHQRFNFQFSGQMFYAVKGGKIAGALRDVAYQSNTIDFWHSLVDLGSAKSWRMFGTMFDGKGQPGQSNPVSHGCPPARFSKHNILNVNARGAK